MYDIEFFEYSDGKRPIYNFLESLSTKHRAKAFWELDLLSEKGSQLREPYAKYVSNGIWELRIKFNSNISRIFYFIPTETKIVLLHGFIKKTERTPSSEIKIALNRLTIFKIVLTNL